MKHDVCCTRFFAGTAVLTSLLFSLPLHSLEYKHVAVAPEHMADQQLLNAEVKGLHSHSTLLPIHSNPLRVTYNNTGNVSVEVFKQTVFLESAEQTPLILLAPDAENWSLSLKDPNGHNVFEEGKIGFKNLPVSKVKLGKATFNGKQVELANPLAGQWQVSLSRKTTGSIKTVKSDDMAIGYLMHKGNPDLQAYAYLDNNYTVQGSVTHVIVKMIDGSYSAGDRQSLMGKKPLLGRIDKAVATVRSPSGRVYSIQLNDDGVLGDKVAGDGRYSGKLPTTEVGVYSKQIQIQGRYDNGQRFSRTTTDIYPIAAASLQIADSSAQLKVGQGTKAVISVPVNRLDDTAEVHLSAQVWGTNSEGKAESAAWVGGIVSVPHKSKKVNLELAFDSRWLSRKSLSAPFSLKAVRLQSIQHHVPLEQRSYMPMRSLKPITSLPVFANQETISNSMLMMSAPVNVAKVNVKQSRVNNNGSVLMLVHGYCSNQAWNTQHFDNAVEFRDYGQSVSHNTFAQRVKQFGENYASFGIVGHSQGGAAALELYAKYYSGLDNASGGRLIQSVGTPYQGTALAGNLALIGEVFGVGCGKNTDLTYNGAANWLSTIPNWARAEVDYYTTSFNTAWWRNDYCNFVTDLFLSDPEDGTTERWAGQLSGARNKGHTKGQCHTSGMRDRPQTQDTQRNTTMSLNAAR